jgi:hypothetical protein
MAFSSIAFILLIMVSASIEHLGIKVIKSTLYFKASKQIYLCCKIFVARKKIYAYPSTTTVDIPTCAVVGAATVRPILACAMAGGLWAWPFQA